MYQEATSGYKELQATYRGQDHSISKCVSQNQLSPGQRFDHLPIQFWSVLQTCARSPALAASSRRLFLGSYNQWSTIINSSRVQGIPLLLVLYTMGLPLISKRCTCSECCARKFPVDKFREGVYANSVLLFFVWCLFVLNQLVIIECKWKKKWSGQMVKTRMKIALGQTRVHTEKAWSCQVQSNNTERTSNACKSHDKDK